GLSGINRVKPCLEPTLRETEMADRRVTRTAKDRDGDITALCGDWGRQGKWLAIGDIEGGVHSYFVDRAGHRSPVRVRREAGRTYLRTDADATSANNLDNL